MNPLQKLARLYHTVRPLKARQIFYLLYYPIKRRLAKAKLLPPESVICKNDRQKLQLYNFPTLPCYQPEKQQFSFLNIEKSYKGAIDWNDEGQGLLWGFQLNYFDWLNDCSLSNSSKQKTLLDYCQTKQYRRIGRLPYPTSIRIVNWCRYLAQYPDTEEIVFKTLAEDLLWLARFPEYHLDGNHLWENGLALLVGGTYLGLARTAGQGEQILNACIEEQILKDGGHIEGSPSYHSQMLGRLMQLIELIRLLEGENIERLKKLETTAAQMLGWLQQVTFKDGSWPMVNDTALHSAPSTASINAFAKQLEISAIQIDLNDSGYRMIRGHEFELFFDLGNIQPAFQPGHSHADIGNFCLQVKGKPFLVDTGTSTYQVGQRRDEERGSPAHNVVVVKNQNSSDVWKSFRIGRRAARLSLQEGISSSSFSHDGFRPSICQRTFEWNNDSIKIADNITEVTDTDCIIYLHFAPGLEVIVQDSRTIIVDSVQLRLEQGSDAHIFEYEVANGFNQTLPAYGLKYSPKNSCAILLISFTQ